jgi:hypothetical protein
MTHQHPVGLPVAGKTHADLLGVISNSRIS